MPFQPGNKGGGKRKEKLMFDALMLSLKRIEDDKPAYVRIAHKLVDLALGGDIQAIKEINNRIDGMPLQQIETTGEVRYVAELPSVIESTEEWLKQSSPKPTVQ